MKNKKNITIILISIILITLSSCYSSKVVSSGGKSQIEINVIDRKTKAPIQGVMVQESGRTFYTDKNGKMLFYNLKGTERSNVTVSYKKGTTTSYKSFPIKATKGKKVIYTVKFNK